MLLNEKRVDLLDYSINLFSGFDSRIPVMFVFLFQGANPGFQFIDNRDQAVNPFFQFYQFVQSASFPLNTAW